MTAGWTNHQGAMFSGPAQEEQIGHVPPAVQTLCSWDMKRRSGGRRTTAGSATENCCPDFHLRDANLRYRRATKADQASTNEGMMNKVNDSNADAPYRLAILHNELSRLRAFKEFLLNLVVIGRNGGENEG